MVACKIKEIENNKFRKNIKTNCKENVSQQRIRVKVGNKIKIRW